MCKGVACCISVLGVLLWFKWPGKEDLVVRP